MVNEVATKRCPHCLSDVPAEAAICRHCQRDTRLSVAEADRVAATPAPPRVDPGTAGVATFLIWTAGIVVFLVMGMFLMGTLTVVQCRMTGGYYYQNYAGVWDCYRR